MKSDSVKYISILIGTIVFIFIVVVVFMVLNNPNSQTANSNSNVNANSNGNSTGAGFKVIENPNDTKILTKTSQYILEKRTAIGGRVDLNCKQGGNESACKSYSTVKSVLEKVNDEFQLSDEFKISCLDELNPQGGTANTKILIDTCLPLINDNKAIKDGVEIDISNTGGSKKPNEDVQKLSGSIEELKKGIIGDKNTNEKPQSLNDRIDSLSNKINILIISLLLSLLLFFVLAVIQIITQFKLYNLSSGIKEKIGGEKDVNWTVFYEFESFKKSVKDLVKDQNRTEQNVNKHESEIIKEKESENEIGGKLYDLGSSNDDSNVNQTNVTEPEEQEAETLVDSGIELLKGLVSEVLDNYPKKVELTKSTYQDTLKEITSTTEIISYYGIARNESGNKKYYAIPAATKINSASESKTLTDFYNFTQSATGGLNGKLKIETPAEIVWNEKTDGWKLHKKGLINIVS